ncbi:hypothetical protein, partial [Holdemania massiliensis]
LISADELHQPSSLWMSTKLRYCFFFTAFLHLSTNGSNMQVCFWITWMKVAEAESGGKIEKKRRFARESADAGLNFRQFHCMIKAQKEP